MLYGHVGEYDGTSESFSDYTGRMDAFIAANNIRDDRKVHMFLATVGASTYKLLKNLCDPDNPNTKTYDELKTLLNEHFEPAPIVIAERHKFWTACQTESETVPEFIVRLKRLASTCAFGAFLDEAMRDKFVSGLHSKMTRTQRHLLSVRDLTFNAAKDKAVADELAGKANEQYMGPVAQANKVYASRRRASKGSASNAGGSNNHKSCFACGSIKHLAVNCKYKDAVCHKCGKKGHIKPVCKFSSGGKKEEKVREVHTDSCDLSEEETYMVNESIVSSIPSKTGKNSDSEFSEVGIYRTTAEETSDKNDFKVQVKLGASCVTMYVDTQATRTTVSEYVYETLLKKYPLCKSKVILRGYSGEKIPVLGEITVPVSYQGSKEQMLELLVVEGRRPALFGRDWLKKIRLDWHNMFSVTEDVQCCKAPKSNEFPSEFNKLLEQNQQLFEPSSSGIKGFTAVLNVKEGAKPVYQKDRPVPYALVPKVEKEYDRLIQTGIVYPIETSDWASPPVHVPKSDDAIRVCGDYKAVNLRIQDDGYKLPNVQDMFAMLSQDKGPPNLFSKIDLACAFNQLLLDDDSSKLLTLNTRRGLLATKRLSFGVKTAPTQFQRVMDKILVGIKNVFCRIDDILVATSGSKEDHLQVLKQVFERLAKYNVRIRAQKCQFFKTEVIYMGFRLSSQGIHPVRSKLDAIYNAPRPTCVTELKSFLGMINFYAKFVENLSSKMHPLFQLLSTKSEWVWSKACEDSFNYAKSVLTSDQILVHHDPNKQVILSVDASPYGLGAVIKHRMDDGSEKPIEYASRTLSPAERNYSQLEKEGLAIIFGVQTLSFVFVC